MKTTDLFKNSRSSSRLNESLLKTFGTQINFEDFDTAKLEDARNKLRTQIYTARSQSGFNETIENETLTKAQWMHDAIVAELMDREEHIVDSTVEEAPADIHETEFMFYGDDGEEGYGTITYEVVDGQVDPASLRGYCEGDGNNKLNDDWCTEMVQPGGDEHEEALAAAQEDYDDQSGNNDDEGGETDDNYALASAGFGSDEDYESIEQNESINTGEDMRNLKEGEIQQASAIVSAKTMVDRVGRWIEELSGMENDTLLQLGDQIRDEMGQDQAKQFISAVAPAIQQALENLKQTRETLATGVRTLTGEEQGAEMLGSEPEVPELGGDEMGPAEPDALNAEEPTDDFAAADAASGGIEAAGREQRESIDRSSRLLRVLAG